MNHIAVQERGIRRSVVGVRPSAGVRPNATLQCYRRTKRPEDTSSRHLWLINYYGERTSTSTLALGYPLLGPSRHVRAYYSIPKSSPGFLCSDPFRHEPFYSLFCRLAPVTLVLGCSRPLVGVDSERFEVVQETTHPLVFLSPHAARAPHHFSEHNAVRQSRIPNARHKSREQDPPPAHNGLDALSSRLYKRVRIRNRVAGAIILSSTNAVSQEAVVARRSVLWWHARGLHVMQPYSIVSSASALSFRILSSSGALGRSYISKVYFRKLYHALRMRRSTSMDRSALWSMFFPRCTNEFVWLYTWSTASMRNMASASGIPFVLKRTMIRSQSWPPIR